MLIFNVFDWCHTPLQVLIFNLLMSYISATYDYAALQATACPNCMKDKHYASTALHVLFPFRSPSQCYVHTCMMTQPVTWWRLYEHTLLWWPVSTSWISFLNCPILTLTLLCKLSWFSLWSIRILTHSETKSHFPQSAESLLPLHQ